MLTFITILFLATLILGHELGHFLAAKILKVRVDEFGIGFPPKLISKKFGETEYSLNLLPFGGFVRIHGETGDQKIKIEEPKRSFSHQPFWKKAIIITAGVLINILIGWFAFSLVFSIGLPEGIIIDQVVDGSPAAEAGFEVGDIIHGFSSTEEFISYLEENLGTEISINGKLITPRVDIPAGEGPLGIAVVSGGIEAQGILESLRLGFITALRTTGLIITTFGSFFFSIFIGNFESLNQISGPIGIFNIVKQAGALGFVYLVQLFGLISINLAVLNMIPFPALDGGRLLFTSLQKVFGEKVFNRRIEIVVNVFGFLLILALMVLVTINDIIKL